jgi:Leucine-rich repeat (LRR) protein
MKRAGLVGRVFGISLVLVMIAGLLGGLLSMSNMFDANDVVAFADANLEDAIRDAIVKPTGDIHSSDLLGLTSLDARERNIVDLTGLEHATSLTKLNLNLNQISDISHLANLTSLTELDLSANQISDISHLTSLTNLTRLSLTSNEVSDVSHLASLTNLASLFLGGNQISDISHLGNLANLTRLDLDYNQIGDISPLTNLTSLASLDLSNNEINDISPLANLINLTFLSLYENHIRDISPLAGLTRLTSLQLQDNQIGDIPSLTNLKNLMSLYLSYNQISDISTLANLISLKWLYLIGNQISDINPLVENEGLSAGSEVDMRWNPLSVTSVNTYIPQLEARGVDVVHDDSTDQLWKLAYQADLGDVEPGNRAEIMSEVRRVIAGRISALRIATPVIVLQEQEGEWSITIQLPSTIEIDRVKKLIARFALLEFKEQDEEGNWIPATGIVNGEQLALSSRYFKENTSLSVDQYGKPILVFEWDGTGAELSKQITTRLLGKPLGVFLGAEPLRGEDGHIIAPVVTAVITDKGQIEGLTIADATELKDLLSAGRMPVPLGRWVKEGQSKIFEASVPFYEGEIPTLPLKCAIELEKCSSEPYLESGKPLCWPASFIGVGASFDIYVGGSTGEIERVRFLSDESQDGVVNAGFAWTPWYYWDVSSGDWHHSSKTMTWSFLTGGEKEIWVEIGDSAGQTNRCAGNIVVPELLPDHISLDDVEIATIISWLTEEWATDESWPVFLTLSLKDSNITANILLIASKDPVTEYKLVRIRTNPVTDQRDLKLCSVLPSTSVGCIKNYVQRMLTEWLTNAGQKLAEKILVEIGSRIVGTALGIDIPASAVSFLSSLIECSEEGYAEPLEGWEAGEDYLIYLPMDLPEGLDLTLKPERGICDCAWATSPWIYCQDCPGQVQGMWKGRITSETNDVFIDIEETDNWWAKYFKLFSPGELRVYDSQGRVTGLVNGDIKEDIPDSAYDGEDSSVRILFPTDAYVVEVVGTDDGSYELGVASIENGETSTLVTSDIPTISGAVHQYTIDWDALSEGAGGVAVQIDSDGDGSFEETKTLHPSIAAFIFSPSNIFVNDEVRFDASQYSDVDSEIVSYQWEFGDGNTSTGEVASHAYPVPDGYVVSLVVVNNDGAVSTQSRIIQVNERQRMPIWGWVIVGIGIVVIAVIVLRRYRLVKR